MESSASFDACSPSPDSKSCDSGPPLRRGLPGLQLVSSANTISSVDSVSNKHLERPAVVNRILTKPSVFRLRLAIHVSRVLRRSSRCSAVLRSSSCWKPSMMISNIGGASSIKRVNVSKASPRLFERPSNESKRTLFSELELVDVSRGTSSINCRMREYVSETSDVDSNVSAGEADECGSSMKNDTTGIRSLPARLRQREAKEDIDSRAACRVLPATQRMFDSGADVHSSSLDTTLRSKLKCSGSS